VTRVIDRLEQSGYVRRVPDPADRRRVIVEVVPEKVAAVRSTLDRVGDASAAEIGRYTDAQLALISEFLTRMEQITRDEATNLRETPREPTGPDATSENAAPLGGLTNARLLVRSGLSEMRLRPLHVPNELYRAQFDGATPQVRLRDGRVIIQYRGTPFDWRKRRANIGLNVTIPWAIDIQGGVGTLDADLRELALAHFELSGGTERVALELGTPRGQGVVRLVGGANTIRIDRPAGLPVRLTVSGGSGRVDLDGTHLGAKGGRTTLESAGWSAATDRYDIEIVGGSKAIEITARKA
jgi:hypothetical protein